MTERIPVTIKLTVGKDDDLIAWWRSIPQGKRQVLIKAAIREYVQHSHWRETKLEQIGEDTAWLREVIAELPTYMERLLSNTAIASPELSSAAVQPARSGQLSTDGVARREQRIASASW